MRSRGALSDSVLMVLTSGEERTTLMFQARTENGAEKSRSVISRRIIFHSPHRQMNFAAPPSIALRPVVDAGPWGEIRNPPICTIVSDTAIHSDERTCLVKLPMCGGSHSVSVFLLQSDQDHKILPERSGLVRPEIGD
jgi:hypothetical protein